MKTKVLRVDKSNIDRKKILYAAKIIKKGNLVAFPTETVYGLGADALNAKAVRKIFKVKKRPIDDPIIVHVHSMEQVNKIAKEIPENAIKLMKKFWPGPLTLILRKKKIVPNEVTANLETVAIRMPSHPVANALIKLSGTPIAAPSANLFGRPSPTKAQHVKEDLNGKIPLIIDAGSTTIGLESTVLDLTSKVPTLLRPGKITLEDLKKVLRDVQIHPVVKVRTSKINLKKFKSPGMKYRHYAPKADVILLECNKNLDKRIDKILKEYTKKGKKVALLLTKRRKYKNRNATMVKFLGNKPEIIAKKIFSIFRELDRKAFDAIIVEGVEAKGFGLAIMNRLRKASVKIVN